MKPVQSILIVALASALSFSSPVLAQFAVTPVTQTQGVAGAATQAQQALNSGASMNMMIGGMLLGLCMSSMMSGSSSGSSSGGSGTQMTNMLVCMMGGLALAQGMQMQQAATQAGATLSASGAQPVASGPVTVLPASVAPSVLPYSIASKTPAINGGLQVLSTSGYHVTSAGVTTPSGKYLPASAFSSSQSLSDMGFDPKAIQAAQTISNRVTREAKQRTPASQDPG